jgi:hypothetical protein
MLVVEVRQWVANVFDFYLWRYGSEIERVDLHRANKSWERDLLKLLVNESAHSLCDPLAIRAVGERIPMYVD